ncbi:MAG: amino acid transporter, partial [bacterium]
KSANLERPYRTPGYPVVPLIYISLALLLVIDLALLKAQTSGIGYLLVLTGIPVYFIWRRNKR